MAKFNKKTEVKTRTTNYMGAKAFTESPKEELLGLLLTSFVSNSYYEKESDTLKRFKEIIEKISDKKFVAKAGIFARDKFGMRSITHVTAGEIGRLVKGEPWTKNFFNKVVVRVDDMSEILSYYGNNYGKPIPNAMKKGFALALHKFDEYQFGKYQMKGRDTSLVDIINLVHPKPNKNTDLFSKIVKGTLKTPDTWETKISATGKNATSEADKNKLKEEAWVELIKTKKIGYMALVRNLRNILEQAPECIEDACSLLENRNLILKSRILPFRFLSAYTAIEEMPIGMFESDKNLSDKVIASLNRAVELSIENLPRLAGKTLILSDNSGSMSGDAGGASVVSAMSNTKTADIANLFATMYWTKCNDTAIGLFGDRLIQPSLNREASIFENFKNLSREAQKCGASTERGIFDMFEKLIKEKIHVDSIVVFSDCQIGSGCNWYDSKGNKGGDLNKLFEKYTAINPNFKMYSISLKEYGTTVFSDKVFKLHGWSEKIFDVMAILEQDKNALINEIEKIEL